jgi:hypothetical protein
VFRSRAGVSGSAGQLWKPRPVDYEARSVDDQPWPVHHEAGSVDDDPRPEDDHDDHEGYRRADS